MTPLCPPMGLKWMCGRWVYCFMRCCRGGCPLWKTPWWVKGATSVLTCGPGVFLWALGVLRFALLSGKMPLVEDTMVG